jgi:spore coat protein CotF
MSSHHAHEVWQWMVENGYYPLEAASQKTLSTFGKLYQTVEEPVLQMQ